MAEDSLALMNIFPREIWMNILDTFVKKQHYNDIQNTINSSPYFQDLAKNKRTTLLFPKVFEVLSPKYERLYSAYKPTRHLERVYREEGRILRKDEQISQSLVSDDNDEYGPRRKRNEKMIKDGKVYPSNHSCILKMRQICRIWCASINQYHEKLERHYRMNHDSDPRDNDDEYLRNSDYREYFDHELEQEEWSVEKFNCWEYKDAIRFLKHYESTQSLEDTRINPFIAKSIDILEGYRGGLDFHYGALAQTDYQFYNAITAILDKYGNHIWFCEIRIRDKFPSLKDYYRQIRNWLVLMPNLKVLKIEYIIKKNSIALLSGLYLRFETKDYLTVPEIDQLKREIGENPLPVLKKLLFLQTDKLPAPIFDGLIKSNCKSLKTLERVDCKDGVKYDVFHDQIPNLNQISIKIGSIEELRILNDIPVPWKLKKAYFDFFNVEPFICWSKLLKLVERKWGSTLTDLMINFPQAKTKTENLKLWNNLHPDNFKVVLPKIKRLKLVFWNEIPFNFLLAMKEILEALELACVYEYNDEKDYSNNYNQIIEISGFGLSPNMWELFPKLKFVHFFDEFCLVVALIRSIPGRNGKCKIKCMMFLE